MQILIQVMIYSRESCDIIEPMDIYEAAMQYYTCYVLYALNKKKWRGKQKPDDKSGFH